MDFEIRLGAVGFGHMRREDRLPGWFASFHGSYACIGPGSTGPCWKALRALAVYSWRALWREQLGGAG